MDNKSKISSKRIIAIVFSIVVLAALAFGIYYIAMLVAGFSAM